MRTAICFFHLLILVSFSTFAGVTPWIEFESSEGHIKIPVAINGIEGHAILDTGSQVNTINSSFLLKNKLKFSQGKKYKIKGVFGIEDRVSYNQVPVNLFGSDFTLNNLVSSSLGHHTNEILLGAGFFNQFIVQIDYPKSRIRILTRDAFDLNKVKNVKMRSDKGTGMPIVNVNLNNEISAWLILDTGNNGGVMVKRSLANRHKWLDKYVTKSVSSMGINSFATTETFRLPTLKFGPYDLENILVSVPGDDQKSNLSYQSRSSFSRIKGKKVRGLLGYDILKHFVLTIDYKLGYLHVYAP